LCSNAVDFINKDNTRGQTPCLFKKKIRQIESIYYTLVKSSLTLLGPTPTYNSINSLAVQDKNEQPASPAIA